MRKLSFVILLFPLMGFAQGKKDKVLEEIFQGVPVQDSLEVALQVINADKAFTLDSLGSNRAYYRVGAGRRKTVFDDTDDVHISLSKVILTINPEMGNDTITNVSIWCSMLDSKEARKHRHKLFLSLYKLLNSAYRTESDTYLTGDNYVATFRDAAFYPNTQVKLFHGFDSLRRQHYIKVVYDRRKYQEGKAYYFWRRKKV